MSLALVSICLLELNWGIAQKNEWICLNLNMATEKDIYYGVENKYKILVEGLFCNEYQLSCDNCKLLRDGCKVSIEIQDSTIDLFKLKLHYNYIIDTINFFVGNIPPPTVFIAAWNKHPPIRYYLDHLKVSIPLFDAKGIVKSFKLNIIRDQQIIYSSVNIGDNFTDSDRLASQKLKIGDIIRLNEVNVLINNRLTYLIEVIDFPIE
jgi:hypothetical protein